MTGHQICRHSSWSSPTIIKWPLKFSSLPMLRHVHPKLLQASHLLSAKPFSGICHPEVKSATASILETYLLFSDTPLGTWTLQPWSTRGTRPTAGRRSPSPPPWLEGSMPFTGSLLKRSFWGDQPSQVHSGKGAPLRSWRSGGKSEGSLQGIWGVPFSILVVFRCISGCIFKYLCQGGPWGQPDHSGQDLLGQCRGSASANQHCSGVLEICQWLRILLGDRHDPCSGFHDADDRISCWYHLSEGR